MGTGQWRGGVPWGGGGKVGGFTDIRPESAGNAYLSVAEIKKRTRGPEKAS